MSLKLFLWTLIFVSLAMKSLSGRDWRCPSESEGIREIGYRWGDKCMSWIHVKWVRIDQWDVTKHLNTICASRLLDGKRYGFLYAGDIQHTAEWRKSIGNIHCAGHFVILTTYNYDWKSKWWRWGWESWKLVSLTAHKWMEVEYRFLQKYGGEIYGDGSDDPVRRFEREGWRWVIGHPLSGGVRYPVCPTYRMTSNGYSDEAPVECSSSKIFWNGIYVACQSRPYDNCVYTKEEYCHYHDGDQKWYRYVVKVKLYAEFPYGKQCPSDIPQEWKIQCEQKCRGAWSEWTGEPKEEHLKCDNVTLTRYQPVSQGDSPCHEASTTCCPGRKVKTYDVKCTDFAYNSTINLKKMGCLNNGTLGRDDRGHRTCLCTDQYRGIQCEEDICEDRCKNNGTCIAGRGIAHCFCQRGFTGKNCTDFTNTCGELDECKNGGKCKEGTTGTTTFAYCECSEGYGGSSCEKKVEKCSEGICNLGVCQEDKGYGTITCTCYEGFQGERCDTQDGRKLQLQQLLTPSGSNVANLVIGLILGFLMLTLCFGGAVVHHHRRRRRRRRGGHGAESTYSSYASSRASTFSTFSTALSRTFGVSSRYKRSTAAVKTKKGDTRSIARASSKNVGISKVG